MNVIRSNPRSNLEKELRLVYSIKARGNFLARLICMLAYLCERRVRRMDILSQQREILILPGWDFLGFTDIRALNVLPSMNFRFVKLSIVGKSPGPK